jgi:hypothetical protein
MSNRERAGRLVGAAMTEARAKIPASLYDGLVTRITALLDAHPQDGEPHRCVNCNTTISPFCERCQPYPALNGEST